MITLTLPWPPSVNGYWRSFRGRNILSAAGRKYKKAARAAVLEQGSKSHAGQCIVLFVMYPPDKRERDGDNHLKACFDALVDNKVIEGDSNRIVLGHELRWGNPIAGGCVEVMIMDT